MTSQFDVSRLREEISRLREELYILRSDLIRLMPDEIAKALTDFRKCNSERDFNSWCSVAIETIIQSSKKSAVASSDGRVHCPLCGAGTTVITSTSQYEAGFTFPEGLKRHLEGFGNVRQCFITRAAFKKAFDCLKPIFEAEEKARKDELERRRQTEPVVLVDLFSPRACVMKT